MSVGYRIHLDGVTITPPAEGPASAEFCDSTRLIASVLLDGKVFVQSEPVSKSPVDGSWMFPVKSDIISGFSSITIRVDDFPFFLPSEPESAPSVPRFDLVTTHPSDILSSSDEQQKSTLSLEINVPGGVVAQPFQFQAGFTIHEFTYLDETAIRFALARLLSEVKDTDDEISAVYESIQALQCSNPERLFLSTLVVDVYYKRHQSASSIRDLGKSIFIQEAIRNSARQQEDAMAWIHMAKHGLLTFGRFERLGHLSDINESVEDIQAAIPLIPQGHPDLPSWLSNLAISLRGRFQRLGDLGDLSSAILNLQDALRMTPEGHPQMPGLLSNLGISLQARFERGGDLEDLNQAVFRLQEAVRLAPDGHPGMLTWLNNLGNLFRMRFNRTGDIEDLDQAVLNLRTAVQLTPEGHPSKPHLLFNLGISLLGRFGRVGNLEDLDLAMLNLQDAVQLLPDGHPSKPLFFTNLGISFQERFKRKGDPEDLDQAMLNSQEAVRRTPDGHPEMPLMLNNLGNCLRTRFERTGEIDDINRALLAFKEIVRLTPEEHPGMSVCLHNLAASLHRRFERLGDLEDLNLAISSYQDAIRLTPEAHPDMLMLATNLGNSLLRRFNRVGELGDLHQAVLKLQDGVRLTPEGHPEMPSRLSNLGNSLRIRFERLGDLSDLNRAVLSFRGAAHLAPKGHPFMTHILNNLGTSLRSRFLRVGDLEDLNQAVVGLQDCVQRTSDTDPDKPLRLHNLGISLVDRFRRLGDLEDLNQAVLSLQDAVRLTPEGHSSMTTWLTSLGSSLQVRFVRLRNLDDFNGAVLNLQDAVKLTPNGNCPLRSLQLLYLGDTLLSQRPMMPEVLRQATSLFSTVACEEPSGEPSVRFKAAQRWSQCLLLSQCPPQESLVAFRVAMQLLPEMPWLGSSLPDRHHQLIGANFLVDEAVAAAVKSGDLPLAVEWMEQGRSVIWGQLLQLRDPLDLLSERHSELGRVLRLNSWQLEEVSSRIEGVEAIDPVGSSYDLIIERGNLLTRIREEPGFERFLLPKLVQQLTPAASGGPVVIFNSSEWNKVYHAVVLLPGQAKDILHLELGSFSPSRARFLYDQLQILLSKGGRTIVSTPEGSEMQSGSAVPPRAPITNKKLDYVDDIMRELLQSGRYEDRDIDLLPHPRTGRAVLGFKEILSELWEFVVKPVLDALEISKPDSAAEKTRLWWCPAGVLSFLPLHAAGLYNEAGDAVGPKLSDFVVSSYTPTLSALLPRTSEPSPPITGETRLLAVAQASPSGHAVITGTTEEIDYIQAELGNSLSIKTLVGKEANIENVVEFLQDSNWVHFACHGVQDPVQPTNSALLLAGNERLTLSRMVELNVARGELAFLSACQSGKGDPRLSDEAVHLGAGMLIAGYKGVIATMWSIRDRDAPLVARNVYRHLRKEGLNSMEAARGLQLAVDALREEHRAPFVSWVPFVHIGR